MWSAWTRSPGMPRRGRQAIPPRGKEFPVGAPDAFREDASDLHALQLVGVAQQQERGVRGHRPHQRVHQGQVDHARLVHEEHPDLQGPQGVAPVGPAALRWLGAPFEGPVQRRGADAAQELPVIRCQARQTVRRLGDGLADPAGRAPGGGGDQHLRREQARVDPVPDGQQRGGGGGLAGAGAAGEHPEGRIDQAGDGEALLGVVEIRGRRRSPGLPGDPLGREDGREGPCDVVVGEPGAGGLAPMFEEGPDLPHLHGVAGQHQRGALEDQASGRPLQAGKIVRPESRIGQRQ